MHPLQVVIMACNIKIYETLFTAHEMRAERPPRRARQAEVVRLNCRAIGCTSQVSEKSAKRHAGTHLEKPGVQFEGVLELMFRVAAIRCFGTDFIPHHIWRASIQAAVELYQIHPELLHNMPDFRGINIKELSAQAEAFANPNGVGAADVIDGGGNAGDPENGVGELEPGNMVDDQGAVMNGNEEDGPIDDGDDGPIDDDDDGQIDGDDDGQMTDEDAEPVDDGGTVEVQGILLKRLWRLSQGGMNPPLEEILGEQGLDNPPEQQRDPFGQFREELIRMEERLREELMKMEERQKQELAEFQRNLRILVVIFFAVILLAILLK